MTGCADWNCITRLPSPLKVEFPDGRTKPITINLPGLDIEVERREHGDENYLNDFTKAYSEEAGRSGGRRHDRR